MWVTNETKGPIHRESSIIIIFFPLNMTHWRCSHVTRFRIKIVNDTNWRFSSYFFMNPPLRRKYHVFLAPPKGAINSSLSSSNQKKITCCIETQHFDHIKTYWAQFPWEPTIDFPIYHEPITGPQLIFDSNWMYIHIIKLEA